jgi:hypothetical protein
VCAQRAYRDVVLFVSLYLLLSVPAFFYINWRTVVGVVDRIYPPDVIGLTVLTVLSGLLLYGFLLADRGVNRFNQFLLVPSDVPSILVALSFLWAAISWWATPELLHTLGVELTLNLYLAVVVASQLPMILLLSLMTAVGRASA